MITYQVGWLCRLPHSQKQFQIIAFAIKRKLFYLLNWVIVLLELQGSKKETVKIFSKSSELFWFYKCQQ